MKKHIYTLLFIFLLAGMTQKLFAQIPNASFENWTNGNPNSWATTNQQANGGMQGSIIESNNAHDGSHAVQFVPVNTGGFYLPVTIYTGDTSGYEFGFVVGSAPDALHGWYIANFQNGDEVEVFSGAFDRANSSAGGLISGQLITDNSSVYKEFAFNYDYPITKAADSVVITFTLLNNGGSLSPNTSFSLDDLSFGSVVNAVKNINSNSIVSLEQNFPNPAADNTNIIYSLQSTSQVTLSVVDMLGRTVKTIVSNEKQTPGRYKAITDISDLAAGNYFYQLSAGGNIVSKLMAVAK